MVLMIPFDRYPTSDILRRKKTHPELNSNDAKEVSFTDIDVEQIHLHGVDSISGPLVFPPSPYFYRSFFVPLKDDSCWAHKLLSVGLEDWLDSQVTSLI